MRQSTVFLCSSFLALAVCAAPARAADDPGCKDHPAFTRMPGFVIDSCEVQDFASREFYDAAENGVAVEGRLHETNYVLQEGARVPSELQIVRNFTAAVQRAGGTLLYEKPGSAWLRLAQRDRELWVQVSAINQGEAYTLLVVEKQAMAQEVTALQLLEELEAKGFVALYINFDTAQATIRPESLPIADRVAAALRQQPALHVSIEGHTDTTGTPEGNKKLSERRARAVLAALVERGVAASRLAAAGWGQERPLADNRTEEGRAKNRRVEIVKK